MTLDSGDRVFFNVTPSGMTLQAVSYDNLEEDGETLEMKGDCDTVQLNGRDVALLLYRLTTADADGCVTAGMSGSSMLRVQTLYDNLGKVTVALETDDNVIRMRAYERDMLVSAVESQAWRLFQ